MKKTILFFILVANALVLASCSMFGNKISVDPAEVYKNYSEEQLFTRAEKSLAKKDYGDAIKYYEALASLYPFGVHSQQSQLDVIYAYYKNRDYVSAEAAADSYIHLYPRSQNVDYAYYMKGMSQFYENRTFLQQALNIDASERDINNAKSAFFTFRDLVQLMPDSKYAPAAVHQMIYLRNVFAHHEMAVSKYYYQRKAYVAAANRASYVVQHFEGSPYVIKALVLMVKANRLAGATEAANDALHVLQVNYPDLPATKALTNSQG